MYKLPYLLWHIFIECGVVPTPPVLYVYDIVLFDSLVPGPSPSFLRKAARLARAGNWEQGCGIASSNITLFANTSGGTWKL